MSLATIQTRALIGITAPPVTVEVHLANGLPALNIVGLPEAAVRESKDRVRAAILNSRFEFPARRITINLAPADLPKEGGRYDLPIALGILAASGQIPTEALAGSEFIGELALSGELRPVRGLLPVAMAAARHGHTLYLPQQNGAEAARVDGLRLHPADSLLAITAHLHGQEPLPLGRVGEEGEEAAPAYPDLDEVYGQHRAKRALEIAAAGGHSLLFLGPPGTGKTMLASRLPGILPPLEQEEALEVAALRSIGTTGDEGGHNNGSWRTRPFRSPHHTASGVALVGGGSHPRPGEISLAHHGVLFLDELPEFDRKVLEVLREPLESGHITISRAARQAEFPARFQLIAAMNPCPCGYLGHPSGRCHCTAEQVARYRGRISGPLLDRIDLHIEVPPLPQGELHHGQRRGDREVERSDQVRERVCAARERQLMRSGTINSRLDNRAIERHCVIDNASQQLLEQAIHKLGLSARAYHRILRVARTIADLAGSQRISQNHLSEAIGYRLLDRGR